MADILAAGAAWLSAQLQVSCAKTVTYSRGPLSVTFTATVGRTPMRIDAVDGGTMLVWTDCDLLFPAASLVLGGNTVLPQRGDRVSIVFGATTVIHEVLAPGGEPEWRWSDQGRTLLRVHCKKVG